MLMTRGGYLRVLGRVIHLVSVETLYLCLLPKTSTPRVHPKDKTPRHKQSNGVSAIESQEECNELYFEESKQRPH